MEKTIGELAEQNPWWKNKREIEADKHISAWNTSQIKWDPRLVYTLDFSKDVVYTIRGPRQVGKTTSVKLKIKDLLEDNVDPGRIFYWACDIVDTSKELVSLLSSYIEWGKKTFLKKRLYIFLDEISHVNNWQWSIKYLYDRGKLEDITLLLTGSHALDIRKVPEKLPGRRGGFVKGGPDKIFLPMKFVEYVETRNAELRNTLLDLFLLKFENRKKIMLKLAEGEISPELERLSLYREELSTLFHDYIITGGIPTAVNEFATAGIISENVYSTYIDVVLGDVMRWGKKDYYLKQILRRVFETLPTKISWRELKKGTDIASHTTVEEYIDILRNIFTANYIYRLDRDRGEPHYEGDKKVYIQDPFIFHALRSWVLGRSYFEESLNYVSSRENISKLVESVICNHLIRFCFNLSIGYQFDYTNYLFYWRSKKDREVDFVIRFPDKYLPIEVKWSNEISKNELYGLFDFMKLGKSHKGIIITENTLKAHTKYVSIPTYLFLALV